MLSKFLVVFAALISSSVSANTLDLHAGYRKADVNAVKWNGSEYGFSYLFDINDALSVGPYLTNTSWKVHNNAAHSDAKADHRELGPEIRFVAPMESLDFHAGATWSLVSKGTATSNSGMTADVAVIGFRFKIGVELPFDNGLGLNVHLIKGIQTVEINHEYGKARQNLDDLALSLGLSF